MMSSLIATFFGITGEINQSSPVREFFCPATSHRKLQDESPKFWHNRGIRVQIFLTSDCYETRLLPSNLVSKSIDLGNSSSPNRSIHSLYPTRFISPAHYAGSGRCGAGIENSRYLSGLTQRTPISTSVKENRPQ
jgi:hypothetical protein